MKQPPSNVYHRHNLRIPEKNSYKLPARKTGYTEKNRNQTSKWKLNNNGEIKILKENISNQILINSQTTNQMSAENRNFQLYKVSKQFIPHVTFLRMVLESVPQETRQCLEKEPSWIRNRE